MMVILSSFVGRGGYGIKLFPNESYGGCRNRLVTTFACLYSSGSPLILVHRFGHTSGAGITFHQPVEHVVRHDGNPPN